MADVRALLKAKRQEARITHPYAAYGANGALRCTACGAAIKVASAWEGHLGSKAHRVAVANLKANAGKEEEGARVTAAAAASKRKVQEEEEGQTKRQRTVEREIAPPDGADDDAHAEADMGASHSFPVDFFSDPARALPWTSADDDDDDEMDQDGNNNAKTAPTPAPEPKSQFDMEWAAFEREMQRRPAGGGAEETTTTTKTKTKGTTTTSYAHATIAAEPELVPRFEGLPVSDDGAAHARAQETAGGVEGEAAARKGAGEAEAEERRRKELDERELIMDRLMEEERAQEDAYGRVALLKNRVQMLKQKRELAKAKGKKAVDMEET